MSDSLPFNAHPTAVIDQPCRIGVGTKIWHFAHISAGAQIGAQCSLGQNTYVAPTAVLGDHVKVQNNVAIQAQKRVLEVAGEWLSSCVVQIPKPSLEPRRPQIAACSRSLLPFTVVEIETFSSN